MGTITDILNLAKARGEELGLPYAGALTPAEACTLWQTAPGARLIDVRTRAERDWVGKVPGSIDIEWLSYPDSAINPHFIQQLRHQADAGDLLLFLCRSGVRSNQAAALATQAGFGNSYNILEGFEGALDARGQRGKIGGWRLAGLPWTN